MAKQAHGDYHRGDMDIHAQLGTYHAFGLFSKWGSLAIAVALLMLTLWFCTSVGFFGGLIPGLVVAVAGILVMRERKPSH